MADIRLLGIDDIPRFLDIRLRSIREEPLSFGSNEGEELKRAETLEERMQSGAAGLLLGAFEDGELVGITGVYRVDSLKFRHRAGLWGVYVAPERRGRGIARQLVAEALVCAAAIDGVEIVSLKVNAANESACRLYSALGFASYGTEPRAMKVGDSYVDFTCMQIELANRAG